MFPASANNAHTATILRIGNNVVNKSKIGDEIWLHEGLASLPCPVGTSNQVSVRGSQDCFCWQYWAAWRQPQNPRSRLRPVTNRAGSLFPCGTACVSTRSCSLPLTLREAIQYCW